MKKVMLLILLVFTMTSIYSITVEEILKVWKTQPPFDNAISDNVVKIHRGTKVDKYEFNAIQNNRGQKFIEITSPPDDSGKIYFIDDEDIWIFDGDSPVNIKGFELRKSFLGSDITYEEEISMMKIIRNAKAEIYEDVPEKDHFIMKIKKNAPGNDIIKFAYIYVYRDSKAIFKVELFNNQDTLFKRITLSDFRVFKGVPIPFYQKVQDMLVTKNFTEIIITDMKVDTALPPNKLNLYELQKRLGNSPPDFRYQ